MSHQRNRKRLMEWERLRQRHPMSGSTMVGSTGYHWGHIRAHWKVQFQNRCYPRGIRRTPYTLRERWHG